jgi:hypothetical protein
MLPITTPLSSERRHCELPHRKCPGCCPVRHPPTLSSFPSVSQAAAPPRRPSKASRRPSSSSSMGIFPSSAAFGHRPDQRSHPKLLLCPRCSPMAPPAPSTAPPACHHELHRPTSCRPGVHSTVNLSLPGSQNESLTSHWSSQTHSSTCLRRRSPESTADASLGKPPPFFNLGRPEVAHRNSVSSDFSYRIV